MTTTVGTASQEGKRSLGGLLFGVIDQPAAVMKEAAARRKWWMWAAPLLIVFAALAVMTVAGAPYTLELAREQAERQLASMPAEQAEMARQGMAASLSQSSMIIAGLVSGLIMLFLGVLAQATFFYFGTLISGGEVQFGSIFTLSAWSRLPFAIHYLTMTAFMAVSQKAIEYQGLGFLVRTGDMFQDMRNPVFNLLSQINIFWLWHLFLMVVGLSVVARFSRGKSLLLTVFYGALALGITVLPTLLFGGMMG